MADQAEILSLNGYVCSSLSTLPPEGLVGQVPLWVLTPPVVPNLKLSFSSYLSASDGPERSSWFFGFSTSGAWIVWSSGQRAPGEDKTACPANVQLEFACWWEIIQTKVLTDQKRRDGHEHVRADGTFHEFPQIAYCGVRRCIECTNLSKFRRPWCALDPESA